MFLVSRCVHCSDNLALQLIYIKYCILKCKNIPTLREEKAALRLSVDLHNKKVYEGSRVLSDSEIKIIFCKLFEENYGIRQVFIPWVFFSDYLEENHYHLGNRQVSSKNFFRRILEKESAYKGFLKVLSFLRENHGPERISVKQFFSVTRNEFGQDADCCNLIADMRELFCEQSKTKNFRGHCCFLETKLKRIYCQLSQQIKEKKGEPSYVLEKNQFTPKNDFVAHNKIDRPCNFEHIVDSDDELRCHFSPDEFMISHCFHHDEEF